MGVPGVIHVSMLRRTFLQTGTLTAGALLLSGPRGALAADEDPAPLPSFTDAQYTVPIADARAIPRFVNPLPRPPRIDLTEGGTRTLYMAQTTQDVLGGGLGLRTPVWGYGQRAGQAGAEELAASYPGPTIVARAGRPVRIDWVNELPSTHLLPVDEQIHWAFTGTDYTLEKNGMPAVVHLHGAHTAPESDGHPDAWYTASGATGAMYRQRRCSYLNDQDTATFWYHDHTQGMSRLNIYAGLAGFYLLRGERELEMMDDGELPEDPYELELVLQDRSFRPDGRLAYPSVTARWPDRGRMRGGFYGPVICVNGVAWPHLEVEPRRYRLRLLNASNSRFFRLSVGGRWPFPTTLVGTDGGFLDTPVPLERPLLLGPAERADVVVDFSDAVGGIFDLANDAPTPYPAGDPVEPPADRVMQFRVIRPYEDRRDEAPLPLRLRDTDFTVAGEPVRTRRLTLLQRPNDHGGFDSVLGTVEDGALAWHDPVTERPRLGDTEVWEFYNATDETHVVHLHMVQFQVLDEAPFTASEDASTGALKEIRVQELLRPDVTEQGPKDTIRVPPREVVRIRVHFDLRGDYVWHCHLLEHEDHGMMRKFQVV
jgi:spore coat protein A